MFIRGRCPAKDVARYPLAQLLGKIRGADLWLHLLPQLLAAFVAARVFLILHPDER